MKKQTRKRKPEFDFTVIPNGAFVIFRTDHPMQLASYLNGVAGLDERGIAGIILDFESEIQDLDDQELARIGLKRVISRQEIQSH